MKILDMEQGSPQWFEARRGVPTASNFSRILTAKTLKPAAAAEEYAYELVGEKLTLLPLGEGGPVNHAMAHGIRTEAEACAWYTLETGTELSRVGFCLTDDGRFGCSPDRLSGFIPRTDGTCFQLKGAVEVKCPQPATQVRYLMEGVLPDTYKMQVHGQLIVLGCPWIDFLSYCPGLPPFMVRVKPDETTDKLRDALENFWRFYSDTLARVKAMA